MDSFHLFYNLVVNKIKFQKERQNNCLNTLRLIIFIFISDIRVAHYGKCNDTSADPSVIQV